MIKRGPMLRIIYEDGETLVTPSHPWLIHLRRSLPMVWRRSEDLVVGDKLTRLLPTWGDPTDYVSGWLAGIADGEGSYSLRDKHKHETIGPLTITQNAGAVATQTMDYLDRLGFHYAYKAYPHKPIRHIHLRGGQPEVMRFLGQVRPRRLLDKFLLQERGEKLRAISNPKILAIEKTRGEYAALQTSCQTYVADGMAMHNTFICDDHMQWFYPRYQHLAPLSFRQFYKPVQTLPPPPNRLR